MPALRLTQSRQSEPLVGGQQPEPLEHSPRSARANPPVGQIRTLPATTLGRFGSRPPSRRLWATTGPSRLPMGRSALPRTAVEPRAERPVRLQLFFAGLPN
jgi:hypothetical protein